MNEQDDLRDEAHQNTYENEIQISRTVTIPLREYESLKARHKTITDKDCIATIDKIEELVRAMIKMRIQDARLNAVVERTEEKVRELRKNMKPGTSVELIKKVVLTIPINFLPRKDFLPQTPYFLITLRFSSDNKLNFNLYFFLNFK